eukprot:CAMPEP_0172479214 /NCGR_PEP_ID=MMETSP1066-20121228/3649_1 /TAXON_ID=671091 /ORGANISM="Coscinodiscus wailesii, Strain CCMP2513" /LENGTH=201 /DNA_ID=CAMNT_0013239471 /DNA_START=78 /DNA_END=683 /DNA_ORIENTATION=+
MSTAIVVPSGLQRSAPSLRISLKKSVSKPFIGKKVAFLKASVSALAEEVKHKQDELDKVLDDLEVMDKQRDSMNTEIEIMASEHSVVVMGLEEQLQAEQSLREKENEEAELQFELIKKELDEDLINTKASKEEVYQDVWAELNKKLEEFQNEAILEAEKTAIDKNLVIAEKDGVIAKLEKDKRSVRKMASMCRKSMSRQLV